MPNYDLSDGEWKLMKLLWEKSPRTIGEMVTALADDTGWTKTTIFVMLKRLIAKDAVWMDDSERLQRYFPLMERRQATCKETDSFLSKVFDGSVEMMMSSLVGQKKLSEQEIADLHRILDEALRQQERKE